jgi:septal ring factor EnvC (AmiA/AmiB activator)
LILDVGDGYHVVMAGLDKLHVDVGQVLVAGEPVGQMGAEQRLSAVTLGVQSARPTLYIEFRKDGAAIDPAPWWAAPFVVSREVGG